MKNYYILGSLLFFLISLIFFSNTSWLGLLIIMPILAISSLILFIILGIKIHVSKKKLDVKSHWRFLVLISCLAIFGALFNSGSCGDYVGNAPNFFIDRLLVGEPRSCDQTFFGFIPKEILTMFSTASIILFFILAFLMISGI